VAGKPVATQKFSMLDFFKADMTDTGLYTMWPALPPAL
jgi:hypothetical protein